MIAQLRPVGVGAELFYTVAAATRIEAQFLTIHNQDGSEATATVYFDAAGTSTYDGTTQRFEVKIQANDTKTFPIKWILAAPGQLAVKANASDKLFFVLDGTLTKV